MVDRITSEIEESVNVKVSMMKDKKLIETVSRIIDEIVSALRRGRKILLCGNGGSAADAQHFSAELVGKFRKIREALPAISLTVNTSILTSIGNDFSFDDVFKRQVEAIGKEGDLLIAISTSGNSKNVIEAVKQAKKMDIFTIGFTGKDGGKLAEICDLVVKVPSSNTPRIQEMHITLFHAICGIVEEIITTQG
ncbi:D-sedoheptulose 7-phosphate isomerase [Candidatus Calescamantes bacterium]|nr:D-sedoheptulose 7-phosphate isomerase [Candidatus Calescamantes bacterium]